MPATSFPISEDTAAVLQQFAVFSFGGRYYQGTVLNDPTTGYSMAVQSDGTISVRLTDGTDTALVDGSGRLLVTGTVASTKGSKTFSDPAPTGTAASVLAANANRISAVLQNVGAVDVFLGNSNAVTVTSGIRLQSGDSFSDGDSSDAWWAITNGSTADLRIVEVA